MQAQSHTITSMLNTRTSEGVDRKNPFPLVKGTSLAVERVGERGKENRPRNAYKIKSKTQVKTNTTKRTTKFALINIISNTRGGGMKERSQEERLRYHRYFNDKENLLQLFKNKYKASFEHRYLEFRSYEHKLDAQFPGLEDKGVFYKMLCNSAKIVDQVMKDNELFPTKSNAKPSVFWSNSLINHDFYASLDCYQKINHFPKSSEISRKDFLFLNIAKMRLNFPRDFDFIPNSFILPKDHGMLVKEMDLNHGKKTYICKPVASSQGKGIFLTNEMAEVS